MKPRFVGAIFVRESDASNCSVRGHNSIPSQPVWKSGRARLLVICRQPPRLLNDAADCDLVPAGTIGFFR